MMHEEAKLMGAICQDCKKDMLKTDGEVKATCLWLRGLPPLKPTKIVEGRHARCHLEPPGPNRWKNRSRTYSGIAEAMADQFTK